MPNRIIECIRPDSCPRCGTREFCKHTKYSKKVVDLRFMRQGVKKWVTLYRFHWYRCNKCRCVFQPEEVRWGKGKFGPSIVAYSLYLNIE